MTKTTITLVLFILAVVGGAAMPVTPSQAAGLMTAAETPEQTTDDVQWYKCQSDTECVIAVGGCDVEWAVNGNFVNQSRKHPPRPDSPCKKPLEEHPPETVAKYEDNICVLFPRGFWAGGAPMP